MYKPFDGVYSIYSLKLTLADGMIAGLLVFAALYWCFRKYERDKQAYTAMLFVFYGALFAITQELVLPWGWHINPDYPAFSDIALVPFTSSLQILHNGLAYDNFGEFLRVVGGNFVLLTPLAILLPALNEKNKLPQVALAAFITSFGIEFFQLVGNMIGAAHRTVEIDDLLENTLGCVLAYLVIVLVKKIIQKVRKES